jgi:hypothetical protein
MQCFRAVAVFDFVHDFSWWWNLGATHSGVTIEVRVGVSRWA